MYADTEECRSLFTKIVLLQNGCMSRELWKTFRFSSMLSAYLDFFFFFFTNMLQLTIFLHKDCWIFKKNLYWCLKQRSFHPSCLPLDSQDRTDSVVHAMGSTSLSGPINERHFNIIRTTSVVWNYIDPSENLCCLNIWMQYRYRLIIFRNKQALC